MNASQEWIEERLATVLTRAADTIRVPDPPALADSARIAHGRSRRRARRWVAVGGAVIVVASGGSIAAANLIQPHTYLDPLRSRVSPTSPAISQALAATMPPGGRIVSSEQVNGADASYDDTIISTNTVTYDFTVYERFSSNELDQFGLARHHLPGGTGWIGSDTPTQRSVYYLSTTGIGVYVREDSPESNAANIQTIETLAQRLAENVATTSKGASAP